MAGLKKKKKESSGSPNIVLVIFLVFFFLVSIGLGIWGYYGYAGQEDLRKAKQTEKALATSEKLAKEYYQMESRFLRAAVGVDPLDQSESEQLKTDYDSFMAEDGGKFKEEKRKDATKKMMAEFATRLGGSGVDLKTDLLKHIIALEARAKEMEGKAEAAAKANKRMEDFITDIKKTRDAFQVAQADIINKESAAQLNAVKAQSQAFQDLSKQLQDLNKEMKDKQDEIGKLKDDMEEQRKQKDRVIARLEKDLVEKNAAGPGGAAVARGGDFPLLLDISPGKPLWDNPVGKITRVDLDTRQVAINVGSSHGAKPELTFNIFAANTYGRAEKQLKGSIEIIKVVDANSSIARITSLYDADGREIVLSGKSRFQLVRESEAPIREGDLLYNLFWGTRVAVVGYVGITGDPNDTLADHSPAEQIRRMDDFMHLLQRNGMQVDAYVDLRDGKIVGNLTSKTRYLIIGDDLRAPGAKKDAKMEGDDKEMKKDEPAKDGGAVNADRNEQVNKSSAALRAEAKERGMLQISAENFANVIGYRRARSANSPELSAFRPSLPYAGQPRPGQAPPPMEEKKAPEMEKKDGN